MLGIKASEEALEKFNAAKLGKKVAYLLFKIENEQIVVDSEVAKADVDEEYLGSFIAAMKETGEPRFAVVDWAHKLLFVSWVPDSSKGVLKMKYASVKEPFVQELQGIQLKLQATDDGELSEEVIKEKCKSNV